MVFVLYIKFDVQSKHGDSGGTDSVLSFYFEYSADGASWQYYTANGENKVSDSSVLLIGLLISFVSQEFNAACKKLHSG